MQYHKNIPIIGDAKFCDFCKKTIVDFTRMEDNAIAAFILRHPHTCGLFYNYQLEKDFMLFVEKRRKISETVPVEFYTGMNNTKEVISGNPKLEVFAIDESYATETVMEIEPNKEEDVKRGDTSLRWLALIFPLSILVHLLHQVAGFTRAAVKTHK